MSNHQSNFDIPVLLAHLPVQFRWLAKAELFKIPIFSRAMRGAGYVRIDRFNRESAIQSIKEAAAKMKDGVSVMIFPEGTRSHDGSIRPFKKGGFVMAVDTGVPIVPVILQGTLPIMDKNSWRTAGESTPAKCLCKLKSQSIPPATPARPRMSLSKPSDLLFAGALKRVKGGNPFRGSGFRGSIIWSYSSC